MHTAITFLLSAKKKQTGICPENGQPAEHSLGCCCSIAFGRLGIAAQYTVGDSEGWNSNVDYEVWAKGKTFYVGDEIVFSYIPGEHNVVMVDEAGYNSCNTNLNLGIYSGSYDSFTLTSPGYVYFICSYHCDFTSQKAAINILPSSP